MPEEIQTPTPTTPVQVESPQPIETPVNPEEKAKELVEATKGRNWLPIILIAVVLLLMGGGVIAGLTIFKDQIPFVASLLRSSPTPMPLVNQNSGVTMEKVLPTQEPVTNEMIIKECPVSDKHIDLRVSTKDWNTYIIEDHLLQFKYPADWKITEENKNGVLVEVSCSGCDNKEQTVDSFRISEVNYKSINEFLLTNKNYQRYNVINFWDGEGLSLSFPGDENGAVKGYFGFYNGIAYLIEIRYPGMANKKAICPFDPADPDIFLTFHKP